MKKIDWSNFDKVKYEKLQTALNFALDAHFGQMRNDQKTFYAMHPIAIMSEVARHTHDIDILIAALLHDTIEDNECITNETIRKHFGDRVEFIVNLLTRRENEKYNSYIQEIVTSRNYASLLIKKCDLEHNMSTLTPLDTERAQNRYMKYSYALKRIEKALMDLTTTTVVDNTPPHILKA